ncbi:MAG: hypothetical protein D6715_11720 [Calditrichaeota bacterium]|nr:MAG: hypothetical protein D6715_11720 [Calditrichota bacterium]
MLRGRAGVASIATACLWLLVALLWPGRSGGYAQQVLDFHLRGTPDRSGLLGNGVTDLLWWEGKLFAGTGFGLNVTADLGESWQQFSPDDYGGKGGVSAMAIAPDGTLWIATGYDTTIVDNGNRQNLSVGGGLRVLDPATGSWRFIPQPKDARSDTLGGMKPTTTTVQNITFDIALLDTQVWIASFGGGIRRSLDGGQSWEVITTDGLPFSALDHLNHRGFSLLAENGNIWVGTAEGISVSRDGGRTWQRFTHRNQSEPISGNWVIALAYNPWDGSVWAATLRAEDTTEFNAISRTRNGGQSWEVYLADELSDGTFPRAIAFYKSTVYVATEKGVYKSVDDGLSWFRFPKIVDSVSGESLETRRFFSLATHPSDAGDDSAHQLWVGSSDGLATTRDNGYTWTVFRSLVSTRTRTEPAVYAYPNPYSPTRHDVLRFQYHVEEATEVVIDIFNFAMEKVVTIRKMEPGPAENSFDRSAKWDGRDSNRRMVDNGVYFFRCRIGDQVSWGKIVVVN